MPEQPPTPLTSPDGDAAYAEAIRLRHEIQFAADTAWPWHDDLNICTRREFLLTSGRAFTG